MYPDAKELRIALDHIRELETLWENAVKARDELQERNAALKHLLQAEGKQAASTEDDAASYLITIVKLREALGAADTKIIKARLLARDAMTKGELPENEHAIKLVNADIELREARALIDVAKGV